MFLYFNYLPLPHILSYEFVKMFLKPFFSKDHRFAPTFLNSKMYAECFQNVTVLNGPFKCAHLWNEIFNHISCNVRVLNVLAK